MRRVAEPSWVLLGFNSSCNQLQILADHITTVIGWKMDGRPAVLKAIQENGIRSDKCIFFY
jgi:hypothetical protein